MDVSGHGARPAEQAGRLGDAPILRAERLTKPEPDAAGNSP
jgi:hypothetical protein